MNKMLAATLILGIFVFAGCATGTSVVAHDTTRSGQFFGPCGITGNNNVVTVERWSRLTKLSIIGDGNQVVIEEGVRIPSIEVWGSDNTVSIPQGLIVKFTQIGHRNRLIERTGIDHALPGVEPYEPLELPPAHEPPPEESLTPEEHTPSQPPVEEWPPVEPAKPAPPEKGVQPSTRTRAEPPVK